MTKRQGELEGFERETIQRIDEAIAAKLEIEEEMKALKRRLDAAQERVDFELAEAKIPNYRYIDGELVIDVARIEGVKLHYRVVQRPKKKAEGDE